MTGSSLKLGKVPPRSFQHVAVLMGGLSAERAVSLVSGAAVADALTGEGYRVTRIDVGRDLSARLTEVKPDACFNALHGRYGEDGIVQGVLECLGIPYTHSGVLSSALAMHKERAKTIMHRDGGVPVADAKVVRREVAAASDQMPPPFVVKPVDEGSSVGVVIVRPGEVGAHQRILAGGDKNDLVMVERYIPGRELTCAVIGDFVTDVIEIVPQKGLAFYDYEAKYGAGGSSHRLAEDLSPDVYQLVRKYTLAAHRSLGCRGVSRADFRYDDTPEGSGALICLEVNTQPGMTGTSLVPELAGHAGWTFGELARWIIEDASCNR